MSNRCRQSVAGRRPPTRAVAAVRRALVAAVVSIAVVTTGWGAVAAAAPAPPAAVRRLVVPVSEGDRQEVAPGLAVVFDSEVPAQARQGVVDAMADLAEAVAFNPAGPVDIAVSWEDIDFLGVGGPVIVETPNGSFPAGLADTLFGGQHAADGIDGFVRMGADRPWYFGLDGRVPPGSYDFVSAFTHELVHALGFAVHTEEVGGLVTLSGATPQFDRLLTSAGIPLGDLSPAEQDRAFRDDEIWIDVGGGRLFPLHADGGRGSSHFGYAMSVADDQPGALMYAGLATGRAHRIDAPVLGVLGQLGYPVRVAPAPLENVSVSDGDGDLTIGWSVYLGPGATTPATISVTLFHDGRLSSVAVAPGGAGRFSVSPNRPVDSLVVTAVSVNGVESSAVRVVLRRTMSSATTLAELVGAVDYDPGHGDVLRLYRAFFNREPDIAGARYWISVRDGGRSLGAIARAFARSPEFTRQYGVLDDRAFLEVIYRNVLGRRYDQAGFAYWLGRLHDGVDRGQVVRWIASAPEFVAAYPYR